MRLRYKTLTLFLIVTVIPVLITATWSIYTLKNFQDKSIEELQIEVNRSITSQVSAFIRSKIENYSIQIVQEGIESINNDQQQYILTEIMRQDSSLLEATIINRSGIETNSINSSSVISQPNINVSTEDYFSKILNNENYIGEVYKVGDQKAVELVTPILNPDKDVIGGLHIKVELDLLNEYIKIADQTVNTRAYVLDKYLNVVTHSNLVDPEALQNAEIIKDVDLFNDFIKKGSGTYLSENNVLMIGVASKINDVDWWVIVERGTNSFVDYLNVYYIQLLIVVLIALLIVVVASLIFTNRISNPINKLIEGSRIIGEGNFKFRVKIPTGDEIQDLGDSLNKMAENLEKTCPPEQKK